MTDDQRQWATRVVDQARTQAAGSRESFGVLMEAQALRAELFGNAERARLFRDAANTPA